LWRIGVALAVGLAAALLSLMRVRRPVSHAPAADDGPVRQGSESGVALQSGRVSRASRKGHSYDQSRLDKWAAGRAGWIVVVALLGAGSLWAGVGLSHAVNPYSILTNATVMSSYTDNSDRLDIQTWIYVRFRTKSGRIVRATIEPANPYGFHTPARGHEIPIGYDPTTPSQAVYAGPGGDAKDTPWTSPPVAYFWAVVWLSLTITLLLTGISRLTNITRAAQGAVAMPVRLRTSGNMAHIDQGIEGYDLEWRLLQDQPDAAGDVHILGEPVAGRWLIVQVNDGRLIWPASKAQPVLTSASLKLPVVQPSPVESVHLLLAGYAQIVDLLDKLPIVIRRQPETGTEWWALGALRPVVRALVNVHLRRRLATLGGALLRAALVCDDEPDSQSRRMLSDASSECRAFASTLSRRSLLAVLATFAATVLSIVSPFLLLPHIPLSGRAVGLWILLVLIVTLIVFGWAPLNVFFHSVRWKRALFNPASDTFGKPISKSVPIVNANVDVYELERIAFAIAELPQPREWEWRTESLVSVIYPAAITILLLSIVVSWQGGTSILALIVSFYIVITSYRWHRRVRARQALWDQANLR
jgi:hypothetical protein